MSRNPCFAVFAPWMRWFFEVSVPLRGVTEISIFIIISSEKHLALVEVYWLIFGLIPKSHSPSLVFDGSECALTAVNSQPTVVKNWKPGMKIGSSSLPHD